MDPRKDPSEDRNEFVARLDKIFDPLSGVDMKDCMQKLIMGDDDYKLKIQQQSTSLESQKQKYLNLYDAASTKEEKMRVVASVKKEVL